MRLKLLAACAILCLTGYATPDPDEEATCLPPTLQKEDIRWYQGPGKNTYYPPHRPETFDPEGLTYASSTDPYNTTAVVLWHSKAIEVRCNDKGPNQIELARGAFRQLEPLATGVLRGAIVIRKYPLTIKIDTPPYARQHTAPGPDNGETARRS